MTLPIGLVSFTVVLTLFSAAVTLMLSPVLETPPPMNLLTGLWKINPKYEAPTPAIAGLVLLFVSLHICNCIAWLHARWAQLCLKRLPR